MYASRLGHASYEQSSDTLLLTPYRDLRGDTALRRVRHLNQCCDFPTAKSLAVQLKGVGAVRKCNICSIQRLERESFGELFSCIWRTALVSQEE